MIKKEDLDKRICDGTEGSNNNQTWREYIRETEEEFCIAPVSIDGLNDEELQQYLDYLDELWQK